MDGSYSLSDIKSVVGDNDGFGFGGGGILAWFLIFALMGGNGFGWGNRGGNPVTEADLCNANSFNDLKSGVRNISEQISSMNVGLTKGLCDFGYTTLAQFNNVEQQLAECCCTTQRAVDSVKFDMANYASAIQMNDTANTQKILDAITGNKIADMQAQIQQLQLQSALCGIPRTNPYGYGIYAYPACAGVTACGTGCTSI